MGSKGQTTTSNQTQTYTPAGGNYIQNALNMAGNAASQPFNMPVAPVAGFSGQQQQAFDVVGQGYNAANPYYQQANNYFQQSATPNVDQFFNPYASAVTANLKDIFGQQMSQTTGQLTQAAGGVGADRIAVGQSELAKQQGLTAGQTLSQLYQPALSAALQEQQTLQGAGYGTAALGQGAQNSALQGAQALLGTGGLQQQLSQAQLNAPYQWEVQKAQFPYQQANFYGGLVSALAPGLGGTTTGQSQTTTPGPSIWSQLLGGGTAAAGLIGGSGGFGSNGWLTGGNGIFASQPTGYQNYGGVTYPQFAEGGAVDDRTRQQGIERLRAAMTRPAPMPQAVRDGVVSGMRNYSALGYAEGGLVSDQPIDVSANPFVPSTQIKPIQPHIPQLQQPAQPSGGGGGGGGAGDILSSAMKIGAMFLKSGGAVPKFADGGAPDDVINPDEPYRMADPAAVDAWRKGVAEDISAGRTAQGSGEPEATPLPSEIVAGASRKPTASAVPPASALAYSGDTAPVTAPDRAAAAAPQNSPYTIPISDRAQQRADSFSQSPWAALTAAGLGMMAGTSPFAGVNIGQGGLAGLKMLESQNANAQKEETIAQAAKRLEQESKFHEDQYTRMTPYQQAQVKAQESRDKLAWEQFNRPYEKLTEYQKEQLKQHERQLELSRVPPGFRKDENGNLQPIPGGPHSPEQIKSEADAKRLPAMAREDMEPMVAAYLAGDHSVLTGIGRGTQGPQNMQQFWQMTAERLRNEGKTGEQIAAAAANFKAESAALRVAAQREGNIQTAVNEAKGTFPQVLKRSEELPRGSFVPFNQAIEYWRTKTGSPEQQRYGAAIQAAITAYSQAMSRTGANSVYAQQHAAQILSSVQGPEAIKAAIEQLDIEMDIALHAPEQTRQSTLKRILGAGATAGAPESATPAPASAGARSPQDQQALEWAKANPTDPRAAAIRQRLGVQ